MTEPTIERFAHAADWLLERICPRRCLGCDQVLKGDRPVCPSCGPLLRRIRGPRCPTCALPRPRIGQRPALGIDAPCRDCRDIRPPQDDTHACWHYDEVVASAIQRAKYAGDRWRLSALADPMADWLARLTDAGELEALEAASTDPPLVTAVPMHPSELRERGYNTAIQVAQHAAGHLDVDDDWEAVTKICPTPQQAGLSREERLANVKDAFEVSDPDRIDGRGVLLFDDVVTTGATVAEVAGQLVDAGAAAVSVIAAARAT